jgi:glutamate-1-semialdehyde 2,1-aminomutase
VRSQLRSQEHGETARRVLPGGVASGLRRALRPHPIAFVSGKGGRLTDVDGNDYVDHVLAWGPMLLGHSHPEVVDAVVEQVRSLQLPGGAHVLEAEVAKQVLGIHTWADRVLWSNTGTEAVQVAIRLARAHTGRPRIVKFAAAYHGWHDSVLISYRNLGDQASALPESAGQVDHVLDNAIVLPFGDLAAAEIALSAHRDEIAAVLVEASLTNSGLIPPPPGFLAGIRALCDEFGIVLILDEVITGFRLSLGGAVEYYGVEPDIAVYAKAIASGFSLSAVVGTAELLDQVVAGVVHAGTYNGSPVALAAASATLDALARDGVHASLEESSANLAESLRESMRRRGVAGAVRMVPGIVQVLPGGTSAGSAAEFVALPWRRWDLWSDTMSAEGVHVLPNGRLFVSTAHTADDLAHTIAAFDQALAREA